MQKERFKAMVTHFHLVYIIVMVVIISVMVEISILTGTEKCEAVMRLTIGYTMGLDALTISESDLHSSK